MLVDDMEWTPLTPEDRAVLLLRLKEAEAQVAADGESVRWWSYRAKLIELILDPDGEQKDMSFGEMVAFAGGVLATTDFQRFGLGGGVRGAGRERAFDGLPGRLVQGLRQFHSNVASNRHVSPFDGSPSPKPLVPKKISLPD